LRCGGASKSGGYPNEEPTTEGGRLADLSKFPVRRVSTSTIKTDVPNLQFKLDVNAEGVQKPLKGEYNELAAGNLLLWESKNGELFVANGTTGWLMPKPPARKWSMPRF